LSVAGVAVVVVVLLIALVAWIGLSSRINSLLEYARFPDVVEDQLDHGA
jgi:Na+-transporting methylmalonyl-CoA/oxaloacetate decarboxylase gamma subunit